MSIPTSTFPNVARLYPNAEIIKIDLWVYRKGFTDQVEPENFTKALCDERGCTKVCLHIKTKNNNGGFFSDWSVEEVFKGFDLFNYPKP